MTEPTWSLRRASALSFALFFIGCKGVLPPPEFEPFELRALPRPEDHPGAGAVVALDRGELTLEIDKKLLTPLARLRRLRRVKVLRPRGVAAHETVVVPIEPTTRVLGFRVRVTAPDGKSATYGHPERTKRGALPALVVRIEDLEPGMVVEAIYDTWFKDLRFIPPWRFEASVPTERSEYAVVVPEGFSVDLRFSEEGRFVARPPDRFETPEGVRFSWSLARLSARYDEAGMPSPELMSPRAHVVFRGARSPTGKLEGLSTWDDVGLWLLGQQPTWSKLSAETVAEAARVAGDVSGEEKALRLLEVVARDLAEEASPPPPLWRAPLDHPEAVLKKKEANPTSRGLLLVALLRSVGLPALPALYAWRTEDVLLPDFPAIRSLDGVAAALPRKDGFLFLDPSTLTVSGSVQPPRLQGQRVVVLREDYAEVIRVPISQPSTSRTEAFFTLRLDPRGDVFGKMEARLTGAEAGALRSRLLGAPPSAFREIVRRFFEERGASIGPTSVSIADLRVLRRPLVVNGSIDERGLVGALRQDGEPGEGDGLLEGRARGEEGEEIFVALSELLGAVRTMPREVRWAPRVFAYPREIELRMTVSLPEAWTTAFAPPFEELEGPGRKIRLGARIETERRFGFLFEERIETLLLPSAQHGAWRRHRLDQDALAGRTFGIVRPRTPALAY